ncbi:hypothetical protein HC891_00735 [Candidatus Gracilibacteria bacterium]|nr:hypothetical protein [Candidatus Gracilibacteria bacterium]
MAQPPATPHAFSYIEKDKHYDDQRCLHRARGAPWRLYAAVLLAASTLVFWLIAPPFALLLGSLATVLLIFSIAAPRPQRPRRASAPTRIPPLRIEIDGQPRTTRLALPTDDPEYQFVLTADGYRLVSGQGHSVVHFNGERSGMHMVLIS